MQPVKPHTTRNFYAILNADGGMEAIDLFAPTQDWPGLNYHLDVLRQIEAQTLLSGRTFVIAYNSPRALPRSGQDVILSLLGDEQHLHHRAHRQVGAVLRCYGAIPPYLDGLPFTELKYAGLLRWSLRSAMSLKRFLQAGGGRPPTLHMPIGLCNSFEPPGKPVTERSFDYGFWGSTHEADSKNAFVDRIALKPKILARRQMLEAVKRVSPKWKGQVGLTRSFQESVHAGAVYETALSDMKIALAPRGGSYETYRFFEACKAGAVIISERLPRSWFYRDHPAVVVSDWSKLPSMLDRLLGDPARLEALSAASLRYWREVVSPKAMAKPVAAFIAKTTTEV